MMPRLMTEEAIMMVERVAMGTGSLSKGHAAEMRATWQRQLGGATLRRPARSLRAVGIKCVRVKRHG